MAFEIRPINGDFVGEVLGVDPGLEVDDENVPGSRLHGIGIRFWCSAIWRCLQTPRGAAGANTDVIQSINGTQRINIIMMSNISDGNSIARVESERCLGPWCPTKRAGHQRTRS